MGHIHWYFLITGFGKFTLEVPSPKSTPGYLFFDILVSTSVHVGFFCSCPAPGLTTMTCGAGVLCLPSQKIHKWNQTVYPSSSLCSASILLRDIHSSTPNPFDAASNRDLYVPACDCPILGIQ